MFGFSGNTPIYQCTNDFVNGEKLLTIAYFGKSFKNKLE
jgi:hypothetical protein